MSSHLIREYVREVLSEVVKKPFKMDLPADLLNLASAFKTSGHQLYVVGGSVRDALMGKEPKDYDVATDAVPDRVIDIVNTLPDHKVIEVGKSFGVIMVVTPDGGEYEIATFREDIGKGRRPDAVAFTSIDKDVMRRDLTINALFYDIDSEEIVDYVGGISDIERNVVKAVGSAKERFDEDKLRILRALRFAGRMGSDLDQETSDAIENDNSLSGVSPERIRDEFLKGIKSAKSVSGFLALVSKYDLFDQIFPGLRVSTNRAITSRNVNVVLALLLDDNDPQVVSKRLNALKYNVTEASHVSFLLRLRDLDVNTAYRLRKLATSSHISDDDMIEYAHARGKPLPKLLTVFIEYELSVSGDELIAQGFAGPALGRELEQREIVNFTKLYDTI